MLACHKSEFLRTYDCFIHQNCYPVFIASQFVSLDDRREIQHVIPTVGNKRTAILSEPDTIYCYTIVPIECVDAPIIEQAIGL